MWADREFPGDLTSIAAGSTPNTFDEQAGEDLSRQWRYKYYLSLPMTAIPLEPEDVCGMHPQDRDLLATASLNEIQNLFAKYLKIKRSQIFDFASRVAQVVRDICGYEDAIFVPFEHFDPDKNPDITPVEIRKVEEGVVSRCGCLLVFLDYASNGVGIETA